MKKKVNKLDLLAAIRKKCLDCSGNMRNEVRDCNIKYCPLWPYRGSGNTDETEQMSVFNDVEVNNSE